MPDDIKARVTADFLKKNMCAPVEKREGTLFVAVEDPYDLTRLDAIKAMNLAPRHEFLVGLRGDILDYINTSYGVAAAPGGGATDVGDVRVHHQGAGVAGLGRRGRGRASRAPSRRSTRPTAAS